MLPYWLLFLVPAAAALFHKQQATATRALRLQNSDPWTWAAAGIALTVLIGYRLEVGGDWFNYQDNLESLRGAELDEFLTRTDPGYHLLCWISLQLGSDLVGVNLACGALFSYGLTSFCRTLPRPWLAFAVAVPYLVVVVGMGYTRQGVALACGMLAIQGLRQRSIIKFLFWSLLGATFHRTALMLLPIAPLVYQRNKFVITLCIAAITFGGYFVLLSESVDALYAGYIEQEYQSEGALVRLMMNAVPGVILLWRRKDFQFTPEEAKLWLWFAWTSILLVAILFATPATTAVDRVGLYLLPLQLVVFSQVPSIFGSPHSRNQGWVFAVLVYYALVQFVWLNFANHAQYWLPYQFYLLKSPS
jgi:hypothetical protein